MLRNYLKTGYRNLLKQKFYSIINILSLAIGITFSLLIGMFVREEYQVNKSLKDVERLYLVQSKWVQEDMGYPIITLAPAAKVIKEQYPSLVENYFRFWDRSGAISNGNKHFTQQIILCDSSLLSMFGFPVLYGNPTNVFQDPFSVVITKQIALKFFGRINVINEVLNLQTSSEGDKTYKICAVLEDLPNNSVTNLVNIDAQIFIPMSNATYFGGSGENSWQGNHLVSYIKATKNASLQDIKYAFKKILLQDGPSDIQGKLVLEPASLEDYYFESNRGANKKSVITLSSIVFFILTMALINFVNINIGTSSNRLKEIGVRKVLGGVRKQLILQFLSESFIITFIASLFSVIFYELVRNTFSDILGSNLISLFDFRLVHIALFLGTVILVGLFAGIYPAFVLSSYNPIASLRGKMKSVKNGIALRRTLITSQFIIAIFVFVAAIIISKQVSYFFNKDMGYKKQAVLTVSSVPRVWNEEGIKKMNSAREEFLRLPQVIDASLSYEIPNGKYGSSQSFYLSGESGGEVASVPVLLTDENFLSTYNLQMKEGDFFHKKGQALQNDKVVINEAMMKLLGWKSAVGKKLRKQDNETIFQVTGVVRDFNFFSLHEAIKPMVFIHVNKNLTFRYFSFRLNPANLQQSVEAIHARWNEVFPNAPFDYKFVDEHLADIYKSEIQLKKAAQLATVLLLIIAFLGIVGMVSLTVVKRSKEVGIRKILGASVSQIIWVFLKEFLLLTLVANAIAWPLAYWIMKDWLANFAYNIQPGISPFVMVGGIVLSLACFIVIIQSLKIASANPANSLKYE